MRTSLALLLCAFALAVPAAANAAAPVGTSPDGFFTDALSCPFDCTMQQDLLANQNMRVPGLPGTANGVVTRWRILGAGGQVRLRRLDGSSKAGLGATQFETLDASGTPRDFGASLPVRTGDALALDVSGGTEIAAVEDTLGLGGDEVNVWLPPVQDGVAPGAGGGFVGYIAYQAFVEPDVDADGLGDETQDPSVQQPGGGGNPPAGGGGDAGGGGPKEDPYAAIRKAGPKVTLAGKAIASKGAALVSATNPYAFAIKGSLTLKAGKKVAGRATLKLGANGSRTVKVKLKRPYSRRKKLKLTARATMKGPVGKKRTTKRKITVAKAAKPKPGKGNGVDGTYRGDGLRADWAMGIEDGIVKSFNGQINTYCTESGRQKRVSFAMLGDDPDPRVGADGRFAWEATKGYGFVKLKFDGKVNKNGTVTASMMVEDRSPLHGSDRFEFDYCFAGEKDFTLRRK
jgi:hypothetical protein